MARDLARYPAGFPQKRWQVKPFLAINRGDIPLASRCLAKGARVLAPTGRIFSEEGIGDALAARDLLSHLRDLGEITGGRRRSARRTAPASSSGLTKQFAAKSGPKKDRDGPSKNAVPVSILLPCFLPP